MKDIHEERTSKDKPFSFKKMLVRYKLAQKVANGRILDIGCGYGYQSEMFKDYFGIDYYQKSIDYAKERYPSKHFKQMDVPPLLFDNGSFDTVLCCEMIEHIDEGSGKELLKEIYRVLNKKGTFFLTTPNASNKEPEKNHLKEYTESEMISLLGGIGFEILSVEGFSISFNKYCPRWLKKLPNLRKMVGKFIDLTLRSFLIQYGKKSPSKAEHMAILCKK